MAKHRVIMIKSTDLLIQTGAWLTMQLASLLHAHSKAYENPATKNMFIGAHLASKTGRQAARLVDLCELVQLVRASRRPLVLLFALLGNIRLFSIPVRNITRAECPIMSVSTQCLTTLLTCKDLIDKATTFSHAANVKSNLPLMSVVIRSREILHSARLPCVDRDAQHKHESDLDGIKDGI